MGYLTGGNMKIGIEIVAIVFIILKIVWRIILVWLILHCVNKICNSKRNKDGEV